MRKYVYDNDEMLAYMRSASSRPPPPGPPAAPAALILASRRRSVHRGIGSLTARSQATMSTRDQQRDAAGTTNLAYAPEAASRAAAVEADNRTSAGVAANADRASAIAAAGLQLGRRVRCRPR